ncbi:MAG: helix-turn-helix domain-containing protein [Planctomycetes bacterium]|nr:helix-turn-helix domain-containing protein [Planctomycetota bacterium]
MRESNRNGNHILTITDVATMLRISRKSVLRLISRGLPGYELPLRGGWRFRRHEILDWMEARRMEDH